MASSRYRFDVFELDVARRVLLRDGAPVALTAKAFDTLLTLVERRGETVDKDVLMRRVWPDTAVEEGNLTQQISTLRKALGEQPDEHRFIVTVARRGYRFVSPLAGIDPVAPRAAITVGREQEMRTLRSAFQQAAAGNGALLSISGEAGIGKTTLVAQFLRELEGRATVLSGRCSERLAPGEPYLPIVEALDECVRLDRSQPLLEALAARAPSWYAQMAPVAGDAPPRHAGSTGASQERQKRELLDFLSNAADARPVILVLDDVQWADMSTLDAVLHLTSRLASIRLLVVLTYRPAELLVNQHDFVQGLRNLRGRGLAKELPLGFLTAEDVAGYVDLTFSGHAFSREFLALVHERTGGNPLFVTDLLRELRERGAVARRDGVWTLTMSLEALAGGFPSSARNLIERTIARLDEGDRRLLLAASVQGLGFDSSVVARALDADAAAVEERLDVLARVHGLIHLVAQRDVRGGEPNLRYAFVHVLYQQALYESLLPSRKAALSGRIADALRAVSTEPEGKLSHELALLLEVARRPVEAVDAFIAAAQHAVSVCATREAAALARRGLTVVSTLPATPDHLGRELQLLITLGVPLAATTGYGNPDVARTYARAHALCQELGASEALFPVLWGQWVLYHVRADFPPAIAAAEQLLALGEQTGDRRMLEVAHTILGYTRGHLGELDVACRHLQQAESLRHPSHHAFYQAVNALDPSVATLCQQGRVLCLRGECDVALEKVEEGRALARSLGVPNAIGFALVWSAYVHQLRLEPDRVRECAEEALGLATEHGLADVRGWAAVLHAWAGHDPVAGAATMRESLAAQRSFGSEIARPHQLGLLADVLLRADDIVGASTALDEALEQASRTGDRYYEPELHRLKGEAALRLGDAAGARQQCQRAVDAARRQGSRLLESRAAFAPV